MNTSLSIFNKESLPFDINNKKWIEIPIYTYLYKLLLNYIPNHSTIPVQSYKLSGQLNKRGHSNGNEEDEEADSDLYDINKDDLHLGYGVFTFKDNKDNILHALHQYSGKPVGTGCGVDVLTSLFIFTNDYDSIDILTDFLHHLSEISQKIQPYSFITYKWIAKDSYWANRSVCHARSIDSVVLPSKQKQLIVNDITKFLSKKTKQFYRSHGIPYRRSYLFHGIPGTGKTSLIQAIAGLFHRSVSILQPTNPDMTDDNLYEAINSLPTNTIVVLEDIDSLFSKDRDNKNDSKITFSGLLNALDGVGSSLGQIFILTTNLIHQLDSALIRKGRVDIQVEFTYAVDEQIVDMWNSFYPSDKDLSHRFLTTLRNYLNNKDITTAILQHFFIMNMDNTADEAIKNIYMVDHELDEEIEVKNKVDNNDINELTNEEIKLSDDNTNLVH